MNVPNSTYFTKSLCLFWGFKSWEAGVPEMERSRCAWSIFFDRIKKYSLEVSASTKTWRKSVFSYCETVCDCVADCVRITRNFTCSACFSWGGDFLCIFLNSVRKNGPGAPRSLHFWHSRLPTLKTPKKAQRWIEICRVRNIHWMHFSCIVKRIVKTTAALHF